MMKSHITLTATRHKQGNLSKATSYSITVKALKKLKLSYITIENQGDQFLSIVNYNDPLDATYLKADLNRQ